MVATSASVPENLSNESELAHTFLLRYFTTSVSRADESAVDAINRPLLVLLLRRNIAFSP
ncbi:MAG TPA: hypothetical protein VKU38_17380 [Ktedonobacteraceae bacterium]|nr:hypothetical protein [Ktedonobacteraceae bacterium]